MTREIEMAVLFLSLIEKDQMTEETRCVRGLFGVDEPERAPELFEEGVMGCHMTGIDPSDKEKVLEMIEESGGFKVEMEDIIPEDVKYIALSLIWATLKGASVAEEGLRKILILANKIHKNVGRVIPGW